MTFFKECTSKLLLGLIFVLFVIKGLFLSLLMPLFQNPDEQTHYGRVQYWAEPRLKTWKIHTLQQSDFSFNPKDIRTSNLPEETTQSAYLLQFDELVFERQNIQNFQDNSHEETIQENNWKRYVDTIPSTAVSGTKSLYYLFASWLEQLFSSESIFVRVLAIRLLSVVFGALTVFLAYLSARKIGFSQSICLLFTALIAFQPMFSITAAQVNIDIALIFSFSLFLYAGVSLLRQGFSWFPFSLLILSIILGIASKGPGIVLAIISIPLLMTLGYRYFHPDKRRFYWGVFLTGSLLTVSAFLLVPATYLASITNLTASSKFDSPLHSIGTYLEKTFDVGPLRNSAGSYWGNFGWLDTPISGWMLSLIIYICIIGLVGAIWYLFSKREQPAFLPERQYIVFFLGTMLALQLAIRFYDWRIFDATGQIVIGQPGRYFLPNLIAFLTVVVSGLGFLVRKKHRFTLLMQVLALSMILLQLHAIVNVILPRYYL